MEQNRFFVFIWRFNAIAIALAACGLLVLSLLALTLLIKDTFRDRSVSNVVNVDQSDKSVETSRHFANFNSLKNTSLLRFELNTKQSYDTEYSSKSTFSNTLNLGFFDTETKNLRWLFPNHDQLILTDKTLFAKPTANTNCDKTTCSPELTTYFVIAADTNGDKRLSRNDKGSLWVSNPDGSQLVKLMDDLQTQPDFHWLSPTSYFLTVSTKTGAQTTQFSLTDKTISNSHFLPVPD